MEESKEDKISNALLDKLKKLMNLISDKAASQGEIESATAKMNALLMKHNLEMSDVEAHSMEKPKVGEATVDYGNYVKKTESDWISKLVHIIARHNLCRAFNVVGTTRYVMIGKKHNVVAVHYMIGVLVEKIKKLEVAAFKDYEQNYVPDEYEEKEKRNTFRRGYLKGCVSGLNFKLQEERRNQERPEPINPFRPQIDYPTNPMAVMIRNNEEELEAHIKQMSARIVEPERQKPGLRKSHVSTQMGIRDGRQINVNKGLDNPKNQIE